MASDFVGREAELSVLEAVCSRANAEGRPGTALLTGPPGVGKTRLLLELSRRQRLAIKLSIGGYQSGTQVPLAAAADLLRTLAKVPDAGVSLDTVLFRANHIDDRPLEPVGVFEAAHRAMVRLQGPILILLDDLQWVDELSIALCSYLIRAAEAEGKGLALIAASRSGGAGATLYEAITRALGSDRATTIALGPLQRDDGVRLARQWMPQISPERAEQLWRSAQGSPFWLGVLARSHGAQDLDVYLIARERVLGRDANQLLSILVVASRPLSTLDLDALLGWADARVDQAAAELERSGFVVVEGQSIRFVHELIRSSAEHRLPMAHRRQLHAQLGRWLEKQAGDDVQLLLEALAHVRKAELDVTNLAIHVVQSPQRRLVGQEGLRQLSEVADSAGFIGPLATNLHHQVALLASELGEQRIAMERWTQLATSVSDPVLRAKAYLGASRAALRIVDRRDEALPLLARAQREMVADPIVEVEMVAHHANLLRVLEHRMDEARRVAERAVTLARAHWAHSESSQMSSQERDAWMTALQVAFDAAVMEDDAPEMLRISEEMTSIARGSEHSMLTAALSTCSAQWFVGRTAEAIDQARRGWSHSHDRVLPMLILATGSTLAGKLIELGFLGEAEEVISECVELERRVGGPSARLAIAKVATRSIHELRHLVWFSRGYWRDAAESLEREVALQPDPHYRLHLHGNMVVWLTRCGGRTRITDVDRHLLAGAEDAVAAGCRRCNREMALRFAEAFVRVGRLDEAREALHDWDLDGRPAEPGDQLWRRHIGALIELADHQSTTGIHELQAVVEERLRRGLIASLLWARLDLAAALSSIDSSRAATELRWAGIEAGAAGAATEQGLAEIGLRRLGVRTWRRGRASDGQAVLTRLTDRERQIAGLVAAGFSNPEIANKLFLSRKTIERHVSNVLARTGTRNRTDLARLVSRATAEVAAEGIPGRD